MFGLKPEKMETQVRLCKARLGLQKNKRTLQVKQMRKDIAELLRTGKQEYARIRVEGVIRENLLLQAYEILSLYLELIAVRSQLIAKTKEIPRDMVEAISSVIYAAQRIADVPELASLRSLFAQKYSKEYAAEASSDVTCNKWQVNQNLINCLLVEPPAPEEKLQVLSEIAQEHGVEWDLAAAAREMLPHGTMPNGLVLPPSAALATTLSGGAPYGGQPQEMGHGPVQPVHPPQVVAPVTPPPAHFLDAQKAAEAAEMAAEHARQMAAWAQQMQTQQAAAQYGGAAHTPPIVPPPVQQTLPPQGWLAAELGGQPVTQPGPSTGPVVPGSGGRTQEEIQKAYDAAVGPPTKGQVSAPPPPPPAPPSAPSSAGPSTAAGSAPPRMPSVPSPGLPSPPPVLPHAPQKDIDPTVPQLPHPPKGLGPSAPEDEYDELAARLDVLKRL